MKTNILFIFLLVVVLSACRKDKDYSFVSAENHIVADLIVNDVFHIVDAEARVTDGIKSADYPCLDTTDVDTTSIPYSLVANFSPSGCPGKFDWSRDGALFLSFSEKYANAGCAVNVALQAFKVEGWKVDGNMLIQRQTDDNDDVQVWSLVADNLLLTSPSGRTSRWSCNTVRTQTEGNSSNFTIDDVFKVTGSGSGTNHDGGSYTVNYNGSVRDKTLCGLSPVGTTLLTVEDDPTHIVNYGEGECDGVIRIEIDEELKLFSFP